MNILMANNYDYIRGGSERVMFEEQMLLESAGITVDRFAQAQGKELDLQGRHSLPNKFKMAWRCVRNSSMKRAISGVLRTFRPDLVHAHNIYGGLTTSVLDAVKRQNIPIALTVHDYKLVCPSYLMLDKGRICHDCCRRTYYHCLVNRCHKGSLLASAVYTAESYYNKWLGKWELVDCFVCPSLFIQKTLTDNGFPAAKTVYLPNFVDPTRYEPSYEPGAYVLFVGRFSREKGLHTLLNAFRELNIPLKLVGDGPERPSCEAFVRSHNLDHITFAGYQDSERLKQLFQRAAFTVVPSEWYENAPMSILEAFAYGKPVLGSNLGGISEMIVHQETGALFRHGSLDDLRGHILSMWQNKSLLRQMGKQARHQVETRFSSQNHLGELLHIYNQLIARRR